MNNKNNVSEEIREQDKGDLKESLSNLFSSCKYMFQSILKRNSIESYLETISEFTDDIIRESKKEGLNYIGGECSMRLNPQNNAQILTIIDMQFHATDYTWKKKQAQRMIEKDVFTDKAVKQIGIGEGLKFIINPPEKR